MWSNTKLLITISTLLIGSGLFFLWFGLQPNVEVISPTPIATTSAELNVKPAVVGIEGERILVTEVIDGDTFEIEGGLKVRVLGVDTPETKDPRKPVGCFGKEASNEMKKILSKQIVILQKDISNTDKYNRLLRYVFLPLENGKILFVNDYLLREGFAKVLTYPPDVKYNERFRQAEKEAKMNKRGLWGRCV